MSVKPINEMSLTELDEEERRLQSAIYSIQMQRLIRYSELNQFQNMAQSMASGPSEK